jgi:hypothetical protein
MAKNTPNSLRLEVLNKVLTSLPVAKENKFLNMFGTDKADSDTVRWMAEYGAMGMTPFAAPGAPAPVTTDDDWWNEGSARAAFYKEKRYFDESFLNNLADELNPMKRKTAEQVLSKNIMKMNYRIDRRREWMMAQMLFRGGFSYAQEKGLKFTVNYGIPDSHKMVLQGNDVWGTGSTRNPVEDIYDMKKVLMDDAGVAPEVIITTSEVVKLLMFDDAIRELLKKSTFGDGNLFANPAAVIGELLGVGPLQVYDDLYEHRSHLLTNLSASATVVVEDATDFEVGGTARIRDMSKPRSYEDIKIDSINFATNTLTLAAACTGTYKGGRDVVICRKRFIDEYSFMMFSSVAEGQKVAEFIEAPYGLDRRWGKYADTKNEWDPDGLWLRIQDKGLPVLYNPETIVTLKVK